MRLLRTALAVAVLIASPVLAPTATAASLATPTVPARPGPARAHAEGALARAEGLLAPGISARTSTGAPGAPGPAAAPGARGDVTMALRDVALTRPALAPAEEQRAGRLLSRPVTDAAIGNAALVVHYDAATYSEAKGNAGYPQTVLDTATYVHDTYVAAGYRTPEPDGVAGGDGRLDIYLTDLGSTGAYGYCASDQPARARATKVAPRDMWAFCVLDDGYTGYPGKPLDLLQVTLAHEYFHAVQFAYDAGEDGWFMEGTAVWAEDELFDDVDDNLQYSPYSPLADPRTSLDRYDEGGFHQYGSWLWFRWLSERFPEAQGGLPTIVRDLWEAADSTHGKVDKRYSLDALATVLRARGLPLPQAFALFSADNRRPTAVYSEAAANGYPVAPLAGTVTVGSRSRSRKVHLDHLTSATTRLVSRGDQGRRRHLRLGVEMAPKAAGSVAVATTYLSSGEVRTSTLPLDGRGDATVRLPFSSRRVVAVEVTLVNASRRFRNCYDKTITYSCFGTPVDQHVVERLTATLVR